MRRLYLAMLLAIGACNGGGGSTADWVVPTPPSEGKGEQTHISGVVKFYQVEGGFYAIQSEDGVTYDPTNLPEEFRQDGLPVEVEALKRPDVMSVRQVGTIVDIVRIRKTPQPGSAKAERTVTGTVGYRERMALPPDAEVRVQLSDVSRMEAAAPIIAETTFTAGGRQVPLPFELRYAPETIEPSHSYAVRATIRSGGSLLFTTDAAHPVITGGNPEKVDLMLVRAGGAANPGSQPAGLIGTAWQLEDLGGAGVIDNSMTTLEFIEAGRVAGRGGCNRFFGSVEIAGGSITFGQMGSTQMACAEALMNQESSYLRALAAAERYTLNGDELLVYSKGLDKPLRFTRMTR